MGALLPLCLTGTLDPRVSFLISSSVSFLSCSGRDHGGEEPVRACTTAVWGQSHGVCLEVGQCLRRWTHATSAHPARACVELGYLGWARCCWWRGVERPSAGRAKLGERGGASTTGVAGPEQLARLRVVRPRRARLAVGPARWGCGEARPGNRGSAAGCVHGCGVGRLQRKEKRLNQPSFLCNEWRCG